MKVTALHYERKRSDGNFGNRSLSITVELEPGEDAELVIQSIAGLVRSRLDSDEQQEEEERRKSEEEQRARYTREREERLRQNNALAEGDDEDDEDDEEEERGDEDGDYMPF